jgi:glycerophosphoryl diester phosphodiesterase
MAARVHFYAHRGAKAVAPENTIPAFEQALAMGVDGIELDVQCSKDGQLVVMHDFTVDKTTNGHGPVVDFSAAELAVLDAGSHFRPSFAGVGVPTLSDVLDVVGDRCRLNVEIKSRDEYGGTEVEPLVELMRARNLFEQILVSSFNPVTLIKLRHLAPKVSIGLLYYRPLPLYLQNAWLGPIIDPQALHPSSGLVDAELMAFARARSLDVNVWTVNEVPEAERLLALGVNAIISDVPDRLMAALAVGE